MSFFKQNQESPNALSDSMSYFPLNNKPPTISPSQTCHNVCHLTGLQGCSFPMSDKTHTKPCITISGHILLIFI